MGKGFLDGYKTYDTSKGHGNKSRWRQSFREKMTKDEAAKIIADRPQTPYEVLGIAENATKETIKKAYRKMISEWHPDRNQQREAEALEMSQRINAAYVLLTNL